MLGIRMMCRVSASHKKRERGLLFLYVFEIRGCVIFMDVLEVLFGEERCCVDLDISDQDL